MLELADKNLYVSKDNYYENTQENKEYKKVK